MKEENVVRLSNSEAKRFTRECICTALLQMTTQKPFDKITITDIIKKSGISRAGFYRNYKSKEEVLEDIATQISDHITTYGVNYDHNTSPEVYFEKIFNHVQENAHIYKMILSSNMNPKQLFPPAKVTELLHLPDEPEARYFHMALMGALFHIVELWINEGMKEAPHEMALICCKLLNKIN